MTKIDLHTDDTHNHVLHISDEKMAELSSDVVDFIINKIVEMNPKEDGKDICGGCIRALHANLILDFVQKSNSSDAIKFLDLARFFSSSIAAYKSSLNKTFEAINQVMTNILLDEDEKITSPKHDPIHS